jgi:spermidine synthase
MKSSSLVYLSLFFISATILCFEIVSTRIASVIFAYDYAFIILSLAILGIGTGGIFSYYRFKGQDISQAPKTFARVLIFLGLSLLVFLAAVTELKITFPLAFFVLLLFPFFFAGVFYSQLFKSLAENSFTLYASDLSGAALGSIASIFMLGHFGAPNCVLFLSVIVFATAIMFSYRGIKKFWLIATSSLLILSAIVLILNGNSSLLGKVPIGDFPEKDFYYVYPDAARTSHIVDSRWSIYGRADLVQYDNQDYVKQLFIDGAAGTQMYRFNGDVKKPGTMLYNLLLSQTTAIPFLFLDEQQRNDMLVIGPGGGKEVLMGLFGGVRKITGVEVNPDFVQIVKNYKQFNGGIYNDFPDVQILVGEGRSYVKQTSRHFDLVVMSLPSTQQLQNIDNLTQSENFLLTTEALQDYLDVLTPSGELIISVHNRLELLRLITTAMAAFKGMGISNSESPDHFLILEQDYVPTIVIKKNAFSAGDIQRIDKEMKIIPAEFPHVTYLPGSPSGIPNTMINEFLEEIKTNRMSVDEFVNQSPFNIAPCEDDSPYFYKLRRGIPPDYALLLGGVSVVNLAVLLIPFVRISKTIKKKNETSGVTLPLIVFICIGLGFMIIEVTLFQTMVLFLGSPTTSLSVLLSSILVGMGLGSFNGRRIFPGNIHKRLKVISLGIVLAGFVLFVTYPLLLSSFMEHGIVVRALLSFLMIVPFGFLLGIPFPTAIQLLKRNDMERFVPWMYGVNGAMSVLGSVIAVILSMIAGFTPSFFVGLFFYAMIGVFVHNNSKSIASFEKPE